VDWLEFWYVFNCRHLSLLWGLSSPFQTSKQYPLAFAELSLFFNPLRYAVCGGFFPYKQEHSYSVAAAFCDFPEALRFHFLPWECIFLYYLLLLGREEQKCFPFPCYSNRDFWSGILGQCSLPGGDWFTLKWTRHRARSSSAFLLVSSAGSAAQPWKISVLVEIRVFERESSECYSKLYISYLELFIQDCHLNRLPGFDFRETVSNLTFVFLLLLDFAVFILLLRRMVNNLHNLKHVFTENCYLGKKRKGKTSLTGRGNVSCAAAEPGDGSWVNYEDPSVYIWTKAHGR